MTNSLPHILIAEDDETLGYILKNILSRAGFATKLVTDGQQALDEFADLKPDLLLLDLLMPKLDGFAVIEKLKTRFKKLPPILVLSNSGQEEETKKALRMGVQGYLIKAELDPGQLVEKIREQIGKQSQKNAGQSKALRTNVLLVEDDRLLQQLLMKALESHSFMVTIAVEGNEALRKANQFRPDIILLDVVLPGKDGLAVLAELKKNPNLAAIPVIIISNLSQETEKEKALALGAQAYIVKADKTLEEIAEIVKRHIEKKVTAS